MKRRNKNTVAAVLLAALVTGCAGGAHSSADAPAVVLVPDNRVIIDSAVVTVDDGALEISGAVHRKPGYSAPVSGRVDIEFVGPNGELLDGLPVLIVPGDVSAAEPSTFRIPYSYIPPQGSVLRIHFVDAETQAREDLEGGFFDAGENGGGGNGRASSAGGVAANGGGHGGGHGGGGNHYSSGHTMGFGSNFGSHRFGPGQHK